MEKIWIVEVKGEKCSKSWEISVIHKDYKLGFESWGRFNDHKFLISHNGGPCDWPICEFVWDEHMKTAMNLCGMLNKAAYLKSRDIA